MLKNNAFCPTPLIKIIICLVEKPTRQNPQNKISHLGVEIGRRKTATRKTKPMSQNQTTQTSTVNIEIFKRLKMSNTVHVVMCLMTLIMFL